MPPKKKGGPSKTKTNKTEGSTENDDDKLAEIEARRKELIQKAAFLKKDAAQEKVQKEEFEKRLEKLKFYWDIEKDTLEVNAIVSLSIDRRAIAL